MTKHPLKTETCIDLRTILITGMLAGTAAGAMGVMDEDGGADFTSIRTAEVVV